MSHPILLLVPSQDRQASIRLLNSRLRPEWLADDWNRHFLADNRYWQLATHVGTGPLLVGFAITFWATLATIFSGLTGLVWEAATLRLLANDPVVAAIKAYEADNGTPSLSLDALVPAYLPAKPEQLQNRPITYVYSLDKAAFGPSDGSRWLLRAAIFTADGDTVQFVFQPSLPGTGPYGQWSRVAALRQATGD